MLIPFRKKKGSTKFLSAVGRAPWLRVFRACGRILVDGPFRLESKVAKSHYHANSRPWGASEWSSHHDAKPFPQDCVVLLLVRQGSFLSLTVCGRLDQTHVAERYSSAVCGCA
jgi:hypothetical protein